MESVDQINPKHYAQFGDYSPLHVIEKWDLNFRTGNAVKYIARAGHKDPSKHVEDLKKAKFYLEREIHLLDPSEPDPTDRNEQLYPKRDVPIGRCGACERPVLEVIRRPAQQLQGITAPDVEMNFPCGCLDETVLLYD